MVLAILLTQLSLNSCFQILQRKVLDGSGPVREQLQISLIQGIFNYKGLSHLLSRHLLPKALEVIIEAQRSTVVCLNEVVLTEERACLPSG